MCPKTEGRVYSSEGCFYLNESAQTWMDAVHYCKNINKDVVMMMPKTNHEMEVVRELMKR